MLIHEMAARARRGMGSVVLGMVLLMGGGAVLVVGGPAQHDISPASCDLLVRLTNRMLDGQAALLRYVAATIEGQAGAGAGALLRGLAHDHPGIRDIKLVDSDGRVVRDTRQGDGVSAVAAEGKLAAVGSDGWIGSDGRGDRTGGIVMVRGSEAGSADPILGLAIEIVHAGGRSPSRLYLLLDTARLLDRVSPEGPSWLIGDDGVVLGSAGGSGDLGMIAGISHSWRSSLGGAGGGAVTETIGGEAHTLLFRHLDNWPATVLVDAGPVEAALPGGTIGAAIVIMLAGGVLMAWGVRPPRRAVAGAAEPAAGEHAETISPGPGGDTADGLPHALAVSVAHEINNILTVVSCDAEMIAAGHPDDAGLGVLSRSILGATARGAVLARRLLASAAPAVCTATAPAAAEGAALVGAADAVTSPPAPVSPIAADLVRILVVDDKAPVRESIARRLRSCGYDVIEAADAVSADRLVRAGVDVMITDIVLDDAQDGFALAARASAHDRLLPIVFMSGFMTARQPEILAGDDLAEFLRKPVNGAELQTVIVGLLALREARRMDA